MVQDVLHFILHLFPDGVDRAERIPVTGAFLHKATVQDDGALDGFDDFEESDLFRRPAKMESAARTPIGTNEAVLTSCWK